LFYFKLIFKDTPFIKTFTGKTLPVFKTYKLFNHFFKKIQTIPLHYTSIVWFHRGFVGKLQTNQ